MSKIEEAIEEIMDRHLSGMDFSDMITNEVRDTWDMDDLDRIDEMDDRLETVESWINDAEDKFSIQNVIDLESSVKNLTKYAQQLELRIAELEQQANKSFIQKLMFWR
jgi:adenylosuccinate synthase